MSIFTLQKPLKNILALFVVIGLVIAPLSYQGKVKEAEAQYIVKDIENIMTSTITTLSTVALEQKELVLDGLFHDIAQKALQSMTGDILKYLNSGLDGNPAFVTDVLKHFQNISDEVAGDFIYGDDLSTLCTPFQLDVRIAIAAQYSKQNYGGYKEDLECSIDMPGVDTAAFLSGDFNAGGWSAWFEISLNPQNTAIGSFAGVNVALNDQIAKKQYAEKQELDWGNGILSKKSCTSVGTGSSAREVCSITTPGILIQEQASKALGAGIDSLLNADEMNEAIGALFGNLAKEAITGVNGLLGLGGNSSFSNNTFGSGGNLSYLDAIREESANKKSNSVGGNKIQQALTTETKVLELELAILEEIDEIVTLFEDTKEPYATDSCWNLELPDVLTDTLDELVVQVPITVSSVVTLQKLNEKWASTTSSSGQLDLMQQLSALQSEGLLQGQTALVEYDYFLNSELKEFVADFKKAILAEENSCS